MAENLWCQFGILSSDLLSEIRKLGESLCGQVYAVFRMYEIESFHLTNQIAEDSTVLAEERVRLSQICADLSNRSIEIERSERMMNDGIDLLEAKWQQFVAASGEKMTQAAMKAEFTVGCSEHETFKSLSECDPITKAKAFKTLNQQAQSYRRELWRLGTTKEELY